MQLVGGQCSEGTLRRPSFGWRATNSRSSSSLTRKWLRPPDARYPGADVSRKRVDEFAHREANILAALWCRLIRRIIGVQENRNDRDYVLPHKAPVDEGVGVPFELPSHQSLYRRDVEAAFREA